MLRVVHVSADYPDAFSGGKTHAVKNLVEHAEDFEHVVYAINRRSRRQPVREIDRHDGVVTLTYGAPPYGLFLERFLRRVADWIVSDCRAMGRRVDLVHGHKFAIEGVIAKHVAQALGCPFICSVQGNTDQKYLRAKPHKTRLYREIAQSAAALLPMTPWIDRYLRRRLHLPTLKTWVLPTPTRLGGFLSSEPVGGRMVTAFSLDRWKAKGVPRLLSALRRLRRDGREISLDIVGDGSMQAKHALDARIRRLGLQRHVRRVGPVEHADIQATFNRYTAFVMPTLRETFGMVYIEALFAGIPILYSRDRSVDGFFDDARFAVGCDPTSVRSIAMGLECLERHERSLKEDIERHAAMGAFDKFQLNIIARRYCEIVTEVTGETTPRDVADQIGTDASTSKQFGISSIVS